ncbi:DUF6054 family protein [Psychrobacillus sp. FSL K6-2684]|uniref:DUF6054 family protein n=1 Tax=Psychrobacillus sp. FSL K6-2684 TaxID=2921547 RepID=UPI0030FD1408
MKDVRDFYVKITPISALRVIEESIVTGSISGKVLDVYKRSVGSQEVVVCVIEKFYYRTSNRASLTITLDNLEGDTKVHAVASGGGQGAFLRFDWGAGGDFVNSVRRALENHIVEQ